MTDDEIKGLFYSYGQYVSGKDYALIRAIEKVIAPQRTEQEPVIDKSAAIRIATALGWEPKREWVGLTIDEILSALKSVDPETKRLPKGFADFAYVVEAKLKEKNSGA